MFGISVISQDIQECYETLYGAHQDTQKSVEIEKSAAESSEEYYLSTQNSSDAEEISSHQSYDSPI